MLSPLVVPKIVWSLFTSHNFDHYANSHSLYRPQGAVVFLAPSLWLRHRDDELRIDFISVYFCLPSKEGGTKQLGVSWRKVLCCKATFSPQVKPLPAANDVCDIENHPPRFARSPRLQRQAQYNSFVIFPTAGSWILHFAFHVSKNTTFSPCFCAKISIFCPRVRTRHIIYKKTL